MRSAAKPVDLTASRRVVLALVGGKLIFHVLSALAEFECDLIGERTPARLAAVRGRVGGRNLGRPEPKKVTLAQALYTSGQTDIAPSARRLASPAPPSAATSSGP